MCILNTHKCKLFAAVIFEMPVVYCKDLAAFLLPFTTVNMTSGELPSSFSNDFLLYLSDTDSNVEFNDEGDFGGSDTTEIASDVDQWIPYVPTNDSEANQWIQHVPTDDSEVNQRIQHLPTDDSETYQWIQHVPTDDSEANQWKQQVSTYDSEVNQCIQHVPTDDSKANQWKQHVPTDDSEVNQCIQHVPTDDSEADQWIQHVPTDDSEADQWIPYVPTDPQLQQFPFTVQNCGFQVPLNSRPIDEMGYFQLFFTDELLTEITNSTNSYAHQKIQKSTPLSQYSVWHTWKDCTLQEIKAFLGVTLNMAINCKSEIQDYFSEDWLDKTPFFKDVFSRNRFFQLFWAFHLVPPTSVLKTTSIRGSEVRNVTDYIDRKCRELFIPHQNIAVDESTVGFKGRVQWKCYNPRKPTKWGLRVYSLCDSSTGYVCCHIPYYGKCTTDNLINPQFPFATRIVLHLTDMLLRCTDGSGYHIFTDRFYTEPNLAMELRKLCVHTTGTCQTNRKGFPAQLKKPRLQVHESISYQKNNLIMATSFRDKRVVTMLSTFYNPELLTVRQKQKSGNTISIEKPLVICEYTKYMGAVDRADQYCGSYGFTRKSHKWWRKLFFWLLEVAIVNSFILWNENRREKNKQPERHLTFRKNIIRQLVGNKRNVTRSKRCRYSSIDEEERLTRTPHFIMQTNTKTTKDCSVCSNRSVRGERHQTSFYCETCSRKPGLHPGICFKKYHTEKKFK